MKPETLAAEHVRVAEIAVEYFREMFLLAFNAMTEGLPQQYRTSALKLLRFYEQETAPETWETLKYIPDPDNPTQSLGESWLQSWEQLSRAVGEKDDGRDATGSPKYRTDAASTAGAY